MSRPPLDPRFALVMERMTGAHADALPTMRRHATMFAENSGLTYDEAVAEYYGLAEPANLTQEPVCNPIQLLPQPETLETPPASQNSASGAISQRVVARLRSEPTIGTRQLAREIGCAANLVVRARARLGLPSPQNAYTHGSKLR